MEDLIRSYEANVIGRMLGFISTTRSVWDLGTRTHAYALDLPLQCVKRALTTGVTCQDSTEPRNLAIHLIKALSYKN